MSIKTQPIILHQTPDWIGIAKPPGWLSIPGRGQENTPVLSDWVKDNVAPIWVVHRLDLETSGAILFAKSPEAHQKACRWFEKHEVKKEYDVLIQGTGIAPVFKINRPIEEKRSVTQFEIKERFGDQAAWLRARLMTGRRHQIRIHLSEEGFPVLGDPKYKGPTAIGGVDFKRVALHSSLIELPDGSRFEAPWPEDFGNWVNQLRGLSERT